MIPFTILNETSKNPIMISSEHSSPKIPKDLNNLGINDQDFDKISHHYDKGTENISRKISKELDARCLLAKFSRLVIDLNRTLDHPELIIKRSFNFNIKNNHNLRSKEINDRITKYYMPYHQKLRSTLKDLRSMHKNTYYINIHSFSNWVKGKDRDIDFCIVHSKKDKVINYKLIKRLNSLGFKAISNSPFSGKNSSIFKQYQQDKYTRSITIEINDKHEKDSIKIANILSQELKSIISEDLR